jgi:hypothetical protein
LTDDHHDFFATSANTRFFADKILQSCSKGLGKIVILAKSMNFPNLDLYLERAILVFENPLLI